MNEAVDTADLRDSLAQRDRNRRAGWWVEATRVGAARVNLRLPLRGDSEGPRDGAGSARAVEWMCWADGILAGLVPSGDPSTEVVAYDYDKDAGWQIAGDGSAPHLSFATVCVSFKVAKEGEITTHMRSIAEALWSAGPRYADEAVARHVAAGRTSVWPSSDLWPDIAARNLDAFHALSAEPIAVGAREQQDEARRDGWREQARQAGRARIHFEYLAAIGWSPEELAEVCARVVWMCRTDGVVCGLVPEGDPVVTVTLMTMDEDGTPRPGAEGEFGAGVEVSAEAWFRPAVEGEIPDHLVELSRAYLASPRGLVRVEDGWSRVRLGGVEVAWSVQAGARGGMGGAGDDGAVPGQGPAAGDDRPHDD